MDLYKREIDSRIDNQHSCVGVVLNPHKPDQFFKKFWSDQEIGVFCGQQIDFWQQVTLNAQGN